MSSPPAPGATASTSKKRRRTSDDPGWALLPEDLIRLVTSWLLTAGDLLDYVRFRAVCRGWRSGTDSPRGRGVTDPRFHPRRWLMLPEGHGLYPGHADLGGYARFVNLDTGRMARARIPLLADHCAIDSVDGLLLLLRDLYNDSAVCLLHPFTGDVTDLPPLATLLPQLGTLLLSCPAPYRLKKLTNMACAAASFVAGGGGAITIVLSLYQVHRVAFASSMDEQWTLASWPLPSCNTPFPFRGKLYILHTPSPSPSSCGRNVHQVLQIDPPVQDGATNSSGFSLKPPRLIATIPVWNLFEPMCLVESVSNILLVGHKDSSMSRLLVYKLEDLVQQRFLPLKSIGGNCLIVGERSMSVSSRVLPTVEGDSVIHLRSSSGQPAFVAEYHLSSDTVSPAIDDCSLYGLAQGPSDLVHHLFSCRTRSLWNRGIVYRRKPQVGFRFRTR